MGHVYQDAAVETIKAISGPTWDEPVPRSLGVFREEVNPSEVDRPDIAVILALPESEDGRVVLIYPNKVELME